MINIIHTKKKELTTNYFSSTPERRRKYAIIGGNIEDTEDALGYVDITIDQVVSLVKRLDDTEEEYVVMGLIEFINSDVTLIEYMLEHGCELSSCHMFGKNETISDKKISKLAVRCLIDRHRLLGRQKDFDRHRVYFSDKLNKHRELLDSITDIRDISNDTKSLYYRYSAYKRTGMRPTIDINKDRLNGLRYLSITSGVISMLKLVESNGYYLVEISKLFLAARIKNNIYTTEEFIDKIIRATGIQIDTRKQKKEFIISMLKEGIRGAKVEIDGTVTIDICTEINEKHPECIIMAIAIDGIEIAVPKSIDTNMILNSFRQIALDIDKDGKEYMVVSRIIDGNISLSDIINKKENVLYIR